MLKLKTLKIFTFLSLLLIMPCVANARPDSANGSVKQVIKDSKKGKILPLNLKNFQGPWVIEAESVGNVGSSMNRPEKLIGRTYIDKNGNGHLNFLKGLSYNAQDESPLDFTNAIIKIAHLEPYSDESGIMEITFAGSSTAINLDFVTIRSQENGDAIILKAVPANKMSAANGIISYTFQRQYQ